MITAQKMYNTTPTLHIIFLSGVNSQNAESITRLLERYTVPHGHEVIVTTVSGDEPKLLGVVVISEDSKTTLNAEYTDIFGSEMESFIKK